MSEDESVREPIEQVGDVNDPDAGDVSEVAAAVKQATEVVVRDVLERDYRWYWFTEDTEALGQVVDLLSVPASEEDPLAETAGKVRAILWQSRHASGGQSAAATCSIFHALGRQRELGWVAREAYLYAMGL
jgi:hypothetical protein